MIFDDLREADSDLVKAALKIKCPVCGVNSGTLCRNLTDLSPLVEGTGRLVHLMRADGL